MAIAAWEQAEVVRANATKRKPVVFVHGLWMLGASWQPWRDLFEENGYATIAPGWPDDPATVEEGRAHPETFAGKSIKQVTDHYEEVIRTLDQTPAIIGHSFGGLITQQLAGRGLSAASVAYDSAPFRGVLPLPFSALKSALPVIGNPANYKRSNSLTYKQFRYSFANAITEAEAKRLYAQYPVPGTSVTLFQAATANVNPKTEAIANTLNPKRGPLLIVTGERDHIAPPVIARASFKKQKQNTFAATEYVEIPGRGHSLVFDDGWRQVAEPALAFVKRFD
jgi:non-heme chloroperoxidase